MLCCEAKQTKKPELVERYLRSEKPLSDEDRNHIADFYTGKGNFALKGRPPNDQWQGFLDHCAAAVKRLKANNPGLHHGRAVDEVAKLATAESDSSWTDFAATLDNYVRRSPKRKKSAR